MNPNNSPNSPPNSARRPRAKLTATMVRAIRARLLAGDQHTSIARLFGVSVDAVYAVAHNRSWAHLDGGTPTGQLPRLHGARGSSAGMAKLTEQEVREIRRLLAQGYRMGVVARAFFVSPDAIYDVKHGRTWKWLLDDDTA